MGETPPERETAGPATGSGGPEAVKGPWKWTAARKRAALLTAEGHATIEEIAARCKASPRQVRRWRATPEFDVEVHAQVERLSRAPVRAAIARRAERVAAQDERWRALRAVVAARAADPTMADVPGGRTGLLVRSHKGLGSGDNFRVVEEYEVDTGLLRELREVEKQAAQEVGQWTEKLAPTTPDGQGEYGGGLTDDDRMARIAALCDLWRARRAAAAAGGGPPPTLDAGVGAAAGGVPE